MMLMTTMALQWDVRDELSVEWIGLGEDNFLQGQVGITLLFQ